MLNTKNTQNNAETTKFPENPNMNYSKLDKETIKRFLSENKINPEKPETQEFINALVGVQKNTKEALQVLKAFLSNEGLIIEEKRTYKPAPNLVNNRNKQKESAAPVNSNESIADNSHQEKPQVEVQDKQNESTVSDDKNERKNEANTQEKNNDTVTNAQDTIKVNTQENKTEQNTDVDNVYRGDEGFDKLPQQYLGKEIQDSGLENISHSQKQEEIQKYDWNGDETVEMNGKVYKYEDAKPSLQDGKDGPLTEAFYNKMKELKNKKTSNKVETISNKQDASKEVNSKTEQTEASYNAATDNKVEDNIKIKGEVEDSRVEVENDTNGSNNNSEGNGIAGGVVVDLDTY